MSAGKYEIYRVPLSNILSELSTDYHLAEKCAKFLLNDISASELADLIVGKDEFIEECTQLFSELVLIENFNTEQFCCLYIALWSLNRAHYYDKTDTDPVSLRLDAEIIDKLMSEVFIDGQVGETCKGEEFEKLYLSYPNRIKIDNLTERCLFIVFADLWSRAVNQVVPLDLLLLTN